LHHQRPELAPLRAIAPGGVAFGAVLPSFHGPETTKPALGRL
jgi:hypothetical protein